MARLLLDDLVQEYLDDFCSCFGARIGVYDEIMNELASGLGLPLCAYCVSRRQDPSFDTRCRESDTRARELSRGQSGAYAYVCHGGMTEAMRCLRVDGIGIGWVMLGQFRTGPSPEDVPEDMQAAFLAAPYCAPDLLKPMLSIFDKLVDHMLSTHRVRLMEELFVERARHYIVARLDKPIDLGEAAKDLGVSVSSLCHRFKEETGETFSAMHRRLRLDRAINLMKSGVCVSVKQAAVEAGYPDPLYFSRAVKDYAGVSPSSFLQPARQ